MQQRPAIARLTEAAAWRWEEARRWLWFVARFRNGAELWRSYRRKVPCGAARFWLGGVIVHPPGASGLAATLLEVWRDRVYAPPGFPPPRKGERVIDAGANVGLFALWAARSGARVVACEPFAENFACLGANAQAHGRGLVLPVRAALGAAAGTCEPLAVGGRSLDHRVTFGAGGVPVLTFAEVLTASRGCDFFKCDIEGAEAEVFGAARAADLAAVGRYAVEYHDHVSPGVSGLIAARLTASHNARVVPDRSGLAFGMIYATRK